MRREIPYLSVLAAAPLAVSAPPQHVTEIRIAGGSGSYAIVSRGCEGNLISKYQANYDDAALEVSHKFPSAVRVGARAGIIQLEGAGEPTRYANPFVSFDWPMLSVGVGYVGADGPFPDDATGEPMENAWWTSSTASGHVRIGKPKFYFSAAYFEGLPLLTSGYLTGGFGRAGRNLGVWLGLGGIPQDRAGLLAQADYRVARGLAIGATARVGSSEGISESAVALRLSYQLAQRSPAPAGSIPAPADSMR